MRVVIFTVVYRIGYGIGVDIKKHTEGLFAHNFEVFLATPDVDGSFTESNGLHVIKIGTSFTDVNDVLTSIKPDVAMVYTPPYFETVAQVNLPNLIKIARDAGEPFPCLFEGEERRMRESLDLKKYRDWIPHYHLHISISEFIKKYSGIRSSVVIYDGSDHTFIEKKEDTAGIQKKLPNPHPFTITTLARIGRGESRYKGFDMVKKLKEKLSIEFPKGQFNFQIIGRIAYGGEMIKADLEKNGIRVIPDLDEKTKQEILIQSHLFFSPSLWEGFNLPLVEAEYLGIPSMALSVGAHPEVCPFHFGTLDEVMRFVITLYQDPHYASACGKICQEYVRHKFVWAKSVSQTVAVLNDAFKRHKEGRLPLLKEVEVPKAR